MKPKAATELSTPELADEYATVRALMMAWKPNVNPHAQRFAELGAELLERCKEEPAEKLLQVQGNKYVVPISAQENVSKIVDKLALYKRIRRLGIETVAETYSITLANVRKLLSKSELQKYILTERSGPRTIGEPVAIEAMKKAA